MADQENNLQKIQNNMVATTVSNQQNYDANVMFRTQCKEMIMKIDPNTLQQNINNAITNFLEQNNLSNQQVGEKIMKIFGDEIVKLSNQIIEAFNIYNNKTDMLTDSCKNFYEKELNDVNVLTNSVKELYNTNQEIIN